MLNKYGVDTISEEIEPHSLGKIAMISIAFLFILMPAASATSAGANIVHFNKDYVKATALCSCGTNGYHYITASFENYCPHCHNRGTLTFNPKGTPEGEWTCNKCSSDYCAADGKEKISGSHYYLKHYTVPEVKQPTKPEVQAQENTTDTLKKQLMNQIANYNNKSFLNI